MNRLGLVLLVVLLPAVASARPVAGTQGMVASAHPAATAAGVKVLRLGGNAADAAAATAFALAVVEPYSSGIGGGGFALIRMGADLVFLDFREVAPRRAHKRMYVDDNGAPLPKKSRDGIFSVAVPGAVAGYMALQEKYGMLSAAQVLAPAIELAAKGFPADSRFVDYVNWRQDVLRQDPEATHLFMVPGKHEGSWVTPPLGHPIVQRDLAHTLRAIAKHGAQVFYTGPIAKKLAADMKSRGGLVTARDLKDYRVRWRAPLVGSYRGHAVATSPPPSSGGQILLTILNVMETLPTDTPFRDPAWVHLYIEACKRAFADRWFLGDPGHVPYVDDLIPQLLTKERAEVLTQVITNTASAARDVPPGQAAQLPIRVPRPKKPAPTKERADTTHLSVVDRFGNAIAMTTTINYGFGSGVVAKGTGVVWNDEMDDFAIDDGVPNAYGIAGSAANAVAGGKTPLSSMSPTMVFEGSTTQGRVQLVIGSPGGSRIPTTVAQAIMHHLDHGVDIEKAITVGRIHHQHLPDTVRVEELALDAATLRALEAMGHGLDVGGSWSNATAIAIDAKTGIRYGAADPRGVGSAMAQ